MDSKKEAQPLNKLLPQGIPDFSSVELTPEETQAALNYARMLKFQKLMTEGDLKGLSTFNFVYNLDQLTYSPTPPAAA